MVLSKYDWIQTYSGLMFYPQKPSTESICIEDIAHALSNTARYNGHTKEFYSVAQHSVLVSQLVNEGLAFAGLLHDASEAYIADIARPVKRMIRNYKEIEGLIQEAVGRKFNVSMNQFNDQNLKEVDGRLLETERLQLMSKEPAKWETDTFEVFDIEIKPLLPNEAKKLFMNRWLELCARF